MHSEQTTKGRRGEDLEFAVEEAADHLVEGLPIGLLVEIHKQRLVEFARQERSIVHRRGLHMDELEAIVN